MIFFSNSYILNVTKSAKLEFTILYTLPILHCQKDNLKHLY